MPAFTVLSLLVFHEYVVPYLHKPPAIAVGVALLAKRRVMRFAGIIKYLRIRSARPRARQFPPVLFHRIHRDAAIFHARVDPRASKRIFPIPDRFIVLEYTDRGIAFKYRYV